MNRNKSTNIPSVGRILSVVLMVFCLSFLTCMNYFIYASASPEVAVSFDGTTPEETESDFPPAGPTEEKSSSSGLSLAEEILHESHAGYDFQASNHLYLHHIAECARIEMFHPERILPPPKF